MAGAEHGNEEAHSEGRYIEGPEGYQEEDFQAFDKFLREWANSPIPNERGESDEQAPDVSGSTTDCCTCEPAVARTGKHWSHCPVLEDIRKENFDRAERLRLR
jgi:hypothetical protein